MKTCVKCGETRPNDDFAKMTQSADGLQSACRVCNNAYAKRHYQANKEHYSEKARRREKEMRAWINELKAKPCMDCGGSFPPVAMDFDHRPGEIKIREVNKMYKASKDAVVAEISKCDLVCANCHRIRTQQRLLVSA